MAKEWQVFRAPSLDDEDKPFCHECQVVFDHQDFVLINLNLGRMLCEPCYDDEK